MISKEFKYSRHTIPQLLVSIGITDIHGDVHELDAKLSTADRYCLIPSGLARDLGLKPTTTYRGRVRRSFFIADIRLPVLGWESKRVRLFESARGQHIRLGLIVINVFKLVADAPRGLFSLEHGGI